jgi:hypothetical protein
VNLFLAASVVQLDGSVLIWHMIDWFSTALCLYGARFKKMEMPTRACGPIAYITPTQHLICLSHRYIIIELLRTATPARRAQCAAGTKGTSRSLRACNLKLLIQFAYSLGLGVNDNRGSPRNMAALTGYQYSLSSPGCAYLVPVVGAISTQTNFFAVHESSFLRKKKPIEGGGYVKGRQTNPELCKKQEAWLRKKRAPYGVRGKYKKRS